MQNPTQPARRPRPLWEHPEHPERLSYEAAILARQPQLAHLLAPIEGGAR